MNKKLISCQLNGLNKISKPAILKFANLKTAKRVADFHHSLPNYAKTPLVKLSNLANYLEVSDILVKDESQRFDLNAFKVLGASFAIAQYLAEFLNLNPKHLNYNKIIKEKEKYKHLIFATATDGNHGRAVAWSAKLFGCQSYIFMPKGSSKIRLNAIKKYAKEASIISMNYDDTVSYVTKKSKEMGWVLIQDKAWVGYEEVPLNIMKGYFTLLTEYMSQEQQNWPTHIFIQAGVGSLPAAIFAQLCNISDKEKSKLKPKLIVVEPNAAACIYKSAENNKIHKIEGSLSTIMVGLACGEPSSIAWEILKFTSDAFLMCNDFVSIGGMRVYGNPLKGDKKITSGESGAATLGVLFELLSNPNFSNIKNELDLNKNSKILLFSTEGDTDPDNYRKIVW